MRGMDCPGLPSQEGCLSHDSAVPDYQPVMPSQVRRLVSPYNPSYTPSENIVPAGLRPPNRTTRTTAWLADTEHYAWARSTTTRDQWRRWSQEEES